MTARQQGADQTSLPLRDHPPYPNSPGLSKAVLITSNISQIGLTLTNEYFKQADQPRRVVPRQGVSLCYDMSTRVDISTQMA